MANAIRWTPARLLDHAGDDWLALRKLPLVADEDRGSQHDKAQKQQQVVFFGGDRLKQAHSSVLVPR